MKTTTSESMIVGVPSDDGAYWPHGCEQIAEGSSILAINKDLVAAVRAIFECHAQAPSDMCGEQRDWYLPRLSKAFQCLVRHFPKQSAEAMKTAEDPYGDLISG